MVNKIFRQRLNKNTFNRLFLHSDPLLCFTREFTKKKKQEYTKEMSDMFAEEDTEEGELEEWN